MFAVVDDDERVRVLEMLDERVDDRTTGLLGNAKCACRCRCDQIGIRDCREFDEPGSIRILGAHRCRSLKCQTCLAGSPHSGDRQEPGAADELLDLGELLIPADEARRQNGEVVGRLVEGDQRRKLRRKAGSRKLEHPLGTDQVPDPMFTEVDEAQPLAETGEPFGYEPDENLPSVCSCEESGGTVQRGAEVVITSGFRFSGVDRHPDSQGSHVGVRS